MDPLEREADRLLSKQAPEPEFPVNEIQPDDETLDPYQMIVKSTLTQWILSDDPTEGEEWDSYCRGLGMDPERLREMVDDARSMYPRLKCGHYAIKSNIYTRYGRKQCRQCATPQVLNTL